MTESTALVRALRECDAHMDPTYSTQLMQAAADALEEEGFFASQMRLVISHLRYAAATIPDKSEYWAGLVAKICSVKKGAN